MTEKPRRKIHQRRRLSLWNVLLLIAIVVMVLPVVGLYFLGIYQSALVRQTERQLLATGDVIALQFQAALQLAVEDYTYREVCGEIGSDAYRVAITVGDRLVCFGQDAAVDFAPIYAQGRLVINRNAQLDLAVDPILPPEPGPVAVARRPRLAVAQTGQDMQATVVEIRNYTLASVRLIDQTGQIIASSNPNLLHRSFEDLDEVQRALSGEPVAVLRAWREPAPLPPVLKIFQAEPFRVHVAVPIMHRHKVLGAVYLSRTPPRLRAVLLNKVPELLLAGLTLVLLVVLLTFGASFFLVRPVRLLVAQAKDAARGVKGAVTPLERPGTQEVAALSLALSTMAKRLEERADYIASFAAQVSHEFKTPLTSIQGAVELLAEHGQDMSEGERAKFLTNMSSDSRRLEKLVSRLLELARADTMEAKVDERADLRATLKAVVARSRDRGQPVTVRVEQGMPKVLWVAMGADTLASVLLNMLDNAYQHGGAEARVLIELTVTPAGASLLIANRGAAISASNAAKIFNPFFTTARSKGGTGLGLSLARSLLVSVGGSIALRPAPKNYATAFSLLVPLAGKDRS